MIYCALTILNILRAFHRFAKKMANSQKQSALASWIASTAKTRHFKILVQKTFNRLHNSVLMVGFESWKRWTALSKQIEHDEQQNLLHAQIEQLKLENQRLLTDAIDKDKQRQEAIVSRLREKIKRGSVSKVFTAWASYSARQHHYRVVTSRFVKKVQFASVFNSLRTWVAYVGEKKRMRTITFRVVNRLVNGNILSAFVKWSAFVKNAIKEEKIVAEKLFNEEISLLTEKNKKLLQDAIDRQTKNASELNVALEKQLQLQTQKDDELKRQREDHRVILRKAIESREKATRNHVERLAKEEEEKRIALNVSAGVFCV